MFIFLKKVFSIVFSFIFGFVSYPISYLPCLNDNEFEVPTGNFSEDYVTLNGEEEKIILDKGVEFDNGAVKLDSKASFSFEDITHEWFNYYGISYSTDAYIKGELSYRCGVVDKTEEFFLEPGENKTFYSFIDNMLNNTKANAVYSLTFEALDVESAKIKINGIALFNREIPDEYVYLQDNSYKIGVNLTWGGALSYMEDLDSDVEAVKVGGRIFVDSNAGERYNAEVVNKNVNLINRHDTGRLVQQSYYANPENYEGGEYMGKEWAYNPVQGGNQFNENSKIIDLRCDESSIYIKCQPLDWAKKKEDITPSYMEATYTIEDGRVHVACRFVDYSGYVAEPRTQEIPAFYCIEPFNRFVYYGGENPWTNDTLTIEPDLIFWPDAGYPKFNSLENWSAFIGEFDDSFGIGLYVPNETRFLSGVASREQTTKEDPSVDGPTSYIAVVGIMALDSYSPFEYEYYLATGNTDEIRSSFQKIDANR